MKRKNLLAKYHKVKDSNRRSGSGADNSFPFFDEMDAVLGTRATPEPPNPCGYRATRWCCVSG